MPLLTLDASGIILTSLLDSSMGVYRAKAGPGG